MRDQERAFPPRAARFLLSLLLLGDDEETVFGDIEEGFHERVRRQGAAAARGWYWRQTLGSVGALWLARLRRPYLRRRRPSRPAAREGWWDALVLDSRHAARRLRRSRGFTTVAVLTLALGIGATTAIFSVVNGVLLQPLGYDHPERLVVVYADLPKIGWFKTWLSGPEVLDLRSRSDVFETVAVSHGGGSATLTGEGAAEQINTHSISREMLPLLGVEPVWGRSFTEEEDEPDGPKVALLSHELWQRRFGGDPGAVGASVTLDRDLTEVVGILPPGFSLELPAATLKPSTADVWLPARVDYLEDRHTHELTPLARLAPGVSVEAARAAMEAFGAQLNERHYRQTTGFALHVFGLQPDLVHRARPALLALLGAVGFVLLIACANVANLLLARAARGEKELGLRAALGAHRGRIVMQVLSESAILGALGGACGLLLAFGGVRLLQALDTPDVPRLDEVSVDGTTLAFAVTATLLTVLLFGLIPALRASTGRRLEAILERTARGTTRRSARGRLRGGLAIFEVALSLVLLVGAGLMVRSFFQLSGVEPGFRSDNLLSFRINLPRNAYGMREVGAYFGELEERISSLPGVESVGSVSHLPLSGINWSGPQTFFDATNGAPSREDFFEVDLRAVTHGYFRTMGIRLLRGRTFDRRDLENGGPMVALIDETLARRVWPGADPVGKRFGVGADPGAANRVEIIGVVNHVRHHELQSEGRGQIYYPHGRVPFPRLHVVARTQGDPLQLAEAVRSEVRAMDPDVPVYLLQTMDDYVAKALSPARFNLVLLGLFALVGVLLSAIGIYGVMAYTVSLRTQELGIRKALGARRGQLLRQVLGEGAKLSLAGVLLGLAGAYALTRFLRSLLFEVAVTDGLTYAGVAALLVGVSLLACYLPGRRASRIDPVIALRSD